jgi:hypothetical protein
MPDPPLQSSSPLILNHHTSAAHHIIELHHILMEVVDGSLELK